MKRTKKFFALALLLSALITVGCGSGGEQEAAAEMAETDASETIGAGTGENTELDIPEVEAGEEKKPEEFLFTEQWITSIEDDRTELVLIVAHHLKESKAVEFSYQDVLLDGAAAENWEVYGLEAITFTTEPGVSSQTLILGTNIDDYSELTIHATANFDDGTEPYLFSGTFQISEIERRIEEKAAATSAEVYVEEQELYSKDGVVITLNQMVEERGGGVSLYFELTNNGTPFTPSLKELYIGDAVIERNDFVEIYEEPKFVILISDEKFKLIKEELPEISVVFEYRAEAGGDLLQTPKLSFPVLSR